MPRVWNLLYEERSEVIAMIMVLVAADVGDADMLLCMLLLDLFQPAFPVVPPGRHLAYIDRYDEARCIAMFRFRPADLRRLQNLFDLPTPVKVGAHGKSHYFHPEEALLVLLRRLAFPNRLVDLVDEFGLHNWEISMLFNWTLGFVHQKYAHLLGSLERWIPHLPTFADAILRKGCPDIGCVGFIDGTLRRMARPGRGQKACYSGHKRTHGIKFQSVTFPNGMIGHLYGPVEGRRHDTTLLAASGLMVS